MTASIYVMAHTSIILVLLLATSVPIHGETACDPQNRASKLQGCLDAIRVVMNDKSKFDFGTDFLTTCPAELRTSMDCAFPTSNKYPGSIVSLAFTPGTYDSAPMDRFIQVTYTTESGEYSACDSTYKAGPVTTFDVDPLSDLSYSPWQLKNEPDISWDTNGDPPGTQYTLLLLDFLMYRLHTIYINIPGNDLTKAKVITPYEGPGNPRDITSPYAFLLFKQTNKDITISQQWQDNADKFQFNISDFITDYQLNGPIAVNWVVAEYGPYAVQKYRMFLENCAPYITEAMKTHDRPFLPKDAKLSVVMRVTLESSPTTVDFCCKTYKYEKRTTILDPIGNGAVKTAWVRSDSKYTVELIMNKFSPNAEQDFEDKIYALIELDPDVPKDTLGTNERPSLNWAVINIADGKLSTGKVLAEYAGAMPPDDKPHTYYFLLYEQTAEINLEDLKEYSTPDCERCLFDINTFVSSNGLTLVGATWMTANNDEYVNSKNKASGKLTQEMEDEVCKDVEGYDNPCPSSAIKTVFLNKTLVALYFCVMYLSYQL